MKSSFLTGLIILLPLAVTIVIIAFIVNLLTDPFTGVVESLLDFYNVGFKNGFLFLAPHQIVHLLSQILVLVTLFLVTVGLGFLTRHFFFHTLLKLGDKLLARIPFVNKVYKTTQEIIKTVFSSRKDAFKQVVMVPFPSANVYSLGLVAGSGLQNCQEATQTELLSVFVPTTPNPTSGYLLMFKKEDIRYLDLKIEDALKYIISCGVVSNSQQEPSSTEGSR